MRWEDVPLLPLPEPVDRRKLREAMGVSQTEAAREIGVSRQTYHRWEQGGTCSPDNHRMYHAQLARWREAVDKFL